MREIFSNREIATIVWITILLLLLITSKSFSKSFISLLKTLFQRRIINLFLLAVIYIELLILFFISFKFWNSSQTKDTILWTLFVGFPLLMKTNKINQEKEYFKSLFKDIFKGIVIIEFIGDFYNFNLIAELIMIPIMMIIVVSQVFTNDKAEYRPITKFLNGLILVFGIIVLINISYNLIQNFGEFANYKTLKSFLFPIILTISFLPILYLVALWSIYEIVIFRMQVKLEDWKDKIYLKIKLFKTFHFNRRKLREFQGKMGFNPIKNRKDINLTIKKFIQQRMHGS